MARKSKNHSANTKAMKNPVNGMRKLSGAELKLIVAGASDQTVRGAVNNKVLPTDCAPFSCCFSVEIATYRI